MTTSFTDRVSGGNPPVDFGACAEACFAGAQQGLSAQQIANNVDTIAGITSPSQGRSY